MSTICYLLQMGKDLLAVLSDSGKLSFLSFSNEMHRFLSRVLLFILQTSCHRAHFTAVWCRFSPIQHVQLSSPGNSRIQPGRMLSIDSRQVFMLFL